MKEIHGGARWALSSDGQDVIIDEGWDGSFYSVRDFGVIPPALEEQEIPVTYDWGDSARILDCEASQEAVMAAIETAEIITVYERDSAFGEKVDCPASRIRGTDGKLYSPEFLAVPTAKGGYVKKVANPAEIERVRGELVTLLGEEDRSFL